MTTKFRTHCPACHQRLRIQEAKRGQSVRCPACRGTFVVTDAVEASQHSMDSTPAAMSMDTSNLLKSETLNDLVGPSQQSMEEPTLRKLGRFELKSVLGAGGFGKVYRAYDPQLERFVALKVPTFGANQKTRIARFLAEAKAAARLKHANIVSTFESGKADKKYYIASEFIEGELLSSLIKSKPPETRSAVQIVRKLADALAYAHEQGIVHRDIKPHNVLIDAAGEPQLMDFGLAKRSDDQSNLTTDGALLGTPAYMSPEQARGELHLVDAKSDQYSLGVVLFHLLTGATPVEGSPHMVIATVAKGEIHSVRDRNPKASRDLEAICQKAMHPDKHQRYSDCRLFAEDLQAWHDGKPILARPITAVRMFARRIAENGLIVFLFSMMIGMTALAAIFAHKLSLQSTNSLFPNAGMLEDKLPDKTSEFKFIGEPEYIAGVLEDKLPDETADPTKQVTTDPALAQAPDQTADQMTDEVPDQKTMTARQLQQACADEFGLPVARAVLLPGGEQLMMVLIPPGEFLMGSTEQEQPDRHDEKPQLRVKITKPFYLGRYEVTQAQWQSVMGSNPSYFKHNPSHPVEQVSWNDIQPFLTGLNTSVSEQDMEFALPTEAQWEYACRAGNATAYSFGDDTSDMTQFGWVSGNADNETHPVGKLRANAFGLHDMHGNVCEWCEDWYSADYYSKSSKDDPRGPSQGELRVNRGGSWYSDAAFCRSAYRYPNRTSFRSSNFGFRLALVPSRNKDGANVVSDTTPSESESASTLSPAEQHSVDEVGEQKQELPALAIAPFDATQAKSHQDAWAQHLGMPIERDITLPGGEKLTMVLIPPGEFMMGSTAQEEAHRIDEVPQHRVQITKPFYLGKYEVSQGQWQSVIGNEPWRLQGHSSLPVNQVSWNDIKPFLAKLNETDSLKGMEFRLPTEAQWEYACRAGSTSPFSFGKITEDLGDFAWYISNAEGRTYLVGQLQANSFGLYDMHGNVWEWCADWYDVDYYATLPMVEPTGPPQGLSRAYRGGSWAYGWSGCRSASRGSAQPKARSKDGGFRLAMSLPAVADGDHAIDQTGPLQSGSGIIRSPEVDSNNMDL